MAKLPRFKKRQLYRIRFIDHAIGDDTVVCELCGWFLRSSKTSVTFTWWLVDTEDEATFLGNLEEVSLAKGAIVSCVPVKREE